MVSGSLRIQAGERIGSEMSTNEMQHELSRLTRRATLIETKEHLVFTAKYHDIPTIMQEIGRLREITFRLAGEGSGNSVDLDVFDNMYDHIVVWHKQRCCVVGAYRVGRVDEQLRRYGRNGLYTATLFTMSDDSLKKMNESLELGRSFVRPEFQRDSAALFMLLKGIGVFRSRYPHYRYLIGAVSISDAYSETSKRLILNSLYLHHYDFTLASNIKPKRPVEAHLFHNWDRLINSETRLPIHEVDSLVKDIEPTGKGVPVLLRHYLAMGAKVAGLHRDENFGRCIDAFVVVDINNANERRLRRYLGNEKKAQVDMLTKA
jgi:putative hemolysin